MYGIMQEHSWQAFTNSKLLSTWNFLSAWVCIAKHVSIEIHDIFSLIQNLIGTLCIHRAGIFDVFVEWTFGHFTYLLPFGLNSYCRTFFQSSSWHQSKQVKTRLNASKHVKMHQNISRRVKMHQNASLLSIQNLIGTLSRYS